MTALVDVHARARRLLAEAGVEDAALDARLLVEQATGTSRLDAIRTPEREIDPATVERVEAMLARRVAGEPVYRIIGSREFFGLSLAVSKDTLDPRPDTEALVELALPALRKIADGKGAARALDLGTGTGAVALALLQGVPQATMLATDISAGALETARANAVALGLASRFETGHGPWFRPVSGKFDGIVSNPPYIRGSDIPDLPREVRDHDPHVALDGGEDGLDAYRVIASEAPNHLVEGGFVAVEIGYDQQEAVDALFAGHGFTPGGQRHDLGGHVRALLFRR
ncbi:MAG: peptide chain release factor N(5)-glutamine methyltransferase [Rhizobiaceae bacterium]|nr:peptide chain release factor N(5)-glutamine methyltransferase [Rhizobiaceae bacterium]MCV0408340.1 peptide chain release factor N(5)-glutamine methyltransferase [Rhizobiaceae bacterium]